MSKKLKYKPVKTDERIDLSLAMSQAIVLLDEVAAYALVANDQALKLEVADRWIEVGKMFAIDVDDGQIIDTNDNVETYGFGGFRDEVKNEDEQP